MGKEREGLSRLSFYREHVLPHIERVVYSGGGAKGVVYSGAYQALKETGVLDGVQVLSGVSSGAITATMVAVGMSPTIFHHLLIHTNLEELMGRRVGSLLPRNKPGVSFLTKDGKPLEHFLRHHVIESVRASLRGIEHLETVSSEHPELKGVIDAMGGDHPCFTFGHLATLHRLFPAVFKQLIIPAIRFPDGELYVFNSERTPDVEVALACRASASLPIVLEPVEIEIQGKKQVFMDGGFFDNLPTEYFDCDSSGAFIKNRKPAQTLVFAFGEGLDNKKNEVFQALYGKRWDEVMSVELLGRIVDDALTLMQQSLDLEAVSESIDEQPEQLIQVTKFILAQQLKSKKISMESAQAMIQALRKSISLAFASVESRHDFWEIYLSEKSEKRRVALFGQMIKEKMRPHLHTAGFLEQLERNVLARCMAGLHPCYVSSVEKEAGYQKIRATYPLRTVELRVGKIKTPDFKLASKYAREMGAFGYLDTITFILNHDLYDSTQFNPDKFFSALTQLFDQIYRGVLSCAGNDLKSDALLTEMDELKRRLIRLGTDSSVINKQIYQLIKDKADGQYDSIQGFALSRAVECYHQTLSLSALLKEIWIEGQKQRKDFSLGSFLLGSLIFGKPEPAPIEKTEKRTEESEIKPENRMITFLKAMQAFQPLYRRYVQEKKEEQVGSIDI